MKKLIAIVAFTFLSIGISQAQQLSEVPSQLTETMITELGLNEQQSASVSKILSVIQPAMEKIQVSDLDDVAKAKKLMSYANREKLNMKNILNDTQFVKYLELTGRI